MAKQKLRLIPLGGLGEIGKNMMAFEFQDDIIVIDAGLMFPEEEMLGVDLVIPDISYLLENRDRLRAIILTHGHEDHVGGLPFLLPQLNVPVYGTPLTIGLVRVKLKERRLLDEATLQIVQAGEEIQIGAFAIEFVHVNHSIPDAVSLILRTPVGTVVYTGDFKFDHTPVFGGPTDFGAFAAAGDEDVLLLCSDSTYVESPGHTPSERVVSASLKRIMAEASGRVIVATFASLISRIQQVIDAAAAHGRKVAVVGRSMQDNVQMALEMGYLTVPEGTLIRIDQIGRLPHHEVAIVTTGSQGEPTSALARMANREHRQIKIVPGDTIVISATPIPGNEEVVNRTIDNLFKQGANVLYSRLDMVHVHGHAAQEELKLMINLVRPRFFVPIHGEHRHLVLHTRLAQALGIPPERTFVLNNGDVLELGPESGRVVDHVPAGYVYVDGLGVGDIGQVILRDRQRLAAEGFVVVIIAIDKQTGKAVNQPDLISRGFVRPEDVDNLMDAARDTVLAAINRGPDHMAEWAVINHEIRAVLGRYFYDQTKRRPMILPVVVEV
ncbi:MAG: ribonuclease J [Chloroflexi bacterium]|nr:ribonuclease J [Chloroflexota bacterium]